MKRRLWHLRVALRLRRKRPDPFDDFEEFQLMRWREERGR